MGIFNTANILLPKKNDSESMKKWSVVACDQYTSEKSYWDRVSFFVNDEASTLNLIFPEAYLSDLDFDKKVSDINGKMRTYLESDVFSEHKNALIFVKRTFKSGAVRHGIIGAVDLEEYDYSPNSTSRIRATEATVIDRLPPRVKIRKNAPLELPHILMLINDNEDSVFGALKKNAPENLLYDFDLMEDGGHITGFLIDSPEKTVDALTRLGTDPLIAVGDGNHSLAAAKKCWEELKPSLSDDEKKNHPMRFALCEIVNLYEDSLVFEPIYRVIFGCDTSLLASEAEKTDGEYSYSVEFVSKEKSGNILLRSACHIESGAVTEFLEDFISKHGGKIDYIHGDDTARAFGREEGNAAFMVRCLAKEELFATVNKFGPLPKKTFSMGNAEEKRFYTEARKLV